MVVGLHTNEMINPFPVASGSIPPATIRTSIKPSRPNAGTLKPEILPPRSAVWVVLPIFKVFNAVLVVRTLA